MCVNELLIKSHQGRTLRAGRLQHSPTSQLVKPEVRLRLWPSTAQTLVAAVAGVPSLAINIIVCFERGSCP